MSYPACVISGYIKLKSDSWEEVEWWQQAQNCGWLNLRTRSRQAILREYCILIANGTLAKGRAGARRCYNGLSIIPVRRQIRTSTQATSPTNRYFLWDRDPMIVPI